ncbi:MAG: hypothetical protein Q4G26_10505 [Paracoccus sp. (in: a-proteobacteria)]|nr:hypothetical protein [Paracoccus sp. (in: a-proteobacteria)]
MRIENSPQIYSNATLPAKRLESAFLEEMMVHLVPKPGGGKFSGGIGEEQFSSFLNREYAAALASSINLGLKVGQNG